jgi:carbon starvation protein CstA
MHMLKKDNIRDEKRDFEEKCKKEKYWRTWARTRGTFRVNRFMSASYQKSKEERLKMPHLKLIWVVIFEVIFFLSNRINQTKIQINSLPHLFACQNKCILQIVWNKAMWNYSRIKIK